MRPCKRFKSPLHHITEGIQFTNQKEVEKIDPYVVAPWEQRIEYEEHTQQDDKQDAAINLLREDGWIIATTAVRNRHGCAYGIAQTSRDTCVARGVRIDPQSIQNPYTAELQAMAEALKDIKDKIPPRATIIMAIASHTIYQVLSNLLRQSGQCAVRTIYKIKRYLAQRGIRLL